MNLTSSHGRFRAIPDTVARWRPTPCTDGGTVRTLRIGLGSDAPRRGRSEERSSSVMTKDACASFEPRRARGDADPRSDPPASGTQAAPSAAPPSKWSERAALSSSMRKTCSRSNDRSVRTSAGEGSGFSLPYGSRKPIQPGRCFARVGLRSVLADRQNDVPRTGKPALPRRGHCRILPS